jgi:hypothetical protein
MHRDRIGASGTIYTTFTPREQCDRLRPCRCPDRPVHRQDEDDKPAQLLLRYLKARTEQLVNYRWDKIKIEAVAQALLKLETITDDIRKHSTRDE